MSDDAPVQRTVALQHWAILASAVPVHVLLALATDLSPDEAYYLCAARASQSIVDHPPLTVWMLGASDRLGWAPVELRVRVWAIAFSFLTSAAIVHLARARGAGPRGTTVAAWVATWALLPMAGGFVTTPDTPTLLAVAVGLVAMARAPLFSGAALLIAALAKVIAIPVGGLLAVGAWAGPNGRKGAAWLLIGPCLALPLLVPSLRFQLHHAFGGSGSWSVAGAISATVAAAGAQAALWSPLVLWLGARGLGRVTLAERALVFGVTALMLVSALVRGVPPEPNWWAPAALVIVVAMAGSADGLSRTQRGALLATVLVPTLVALAHTVRPFLPLAGRVDPTARLHGWSTGREPLEAPGLGRYGAAAERCVYRNACEEIVSYFSEMKDEVKRH